MKLAAVCTLAVVGGAALALGCSSDQDATESGGSAAGGSTDSSASGGQAPSSGGGQAGGGGAGSGGADVFAGGNLGIGGDGPSSGGTALGGAGGSAGIGGSDAVGGSGVGGTGQVLGGSLGMNDVTILVPLPDNTDEPVLLLGSDSATDGTPFVPRALFDRLGSEGTEFFPGTYERLQLVAVRFDLCDHKAPGPCPLSGEASLRLVFQPLRADFGVDDVGIHAFYSIGEAEVPAALQALGELAALRSGPAEPLAPSVSLMGGNAEYAESLRAFVRSYGGEGRLLRLAVNAQSAISAAVTWMFREVEKQGAEFEDRPITGTSEMIQRVTLEGDGFFRVEPVSDSPPGLARVLDSSEFRGSSEAEQRAALEALVAIDNPLTNGPDTVACVACHTSTVALATRAEDMRLDPGSLQGRYMTSFDVSVGAGMSATSDRTLRALGWIGTTPMISQRVAHDTALVLEDIARRFEERR